MKKTLIFLFMCLPMMSMAQSTLTPEQKLEQAQRQLEQAKAALEEAKANAAKAEAEARARKAAEAKDIEKKIAEAKAETERLKHEAAAINEAAGKRRPPPRPVRTRRRTMPTGRMRQIRGVFRLHRLLCHVPPRLPARTAKKTRNFIFRRMPFRK